MVPILKIGVTGGIGSGKTTICRIFETLGIPVFSADDASKNMLHEDPEVIKKVKQTFGDEIYTGNKPDRKKIASIVFNDPEKLAALNAIIHPAVFRKFENWAKQQQDIPYIIKEAALIYEAGGDVALDHVIVVTAPESLRVSRIIKRDNTSEKEVRARMKNQWSEEEKIKRADFTIQNDDEHLLIPQVLDIHRKLTQHTS